MQKDPHTNSNPDESAREYSRLNPADSLPYGLPVSMWGSLVGALVIMIIVAVVHPSMVERIKFVTENALTILLLFVVITQAYIYHRQWKAMEEQRHVMNKQLDVARKQFEASNRPWLSVDIGLVSSFTINPHRALSIRYTIKNVGHSVANDVRVEAQMLFVPLKEARDAPIRIQNELRTKTERPFSPAMVIFPQLDERLDIGYAPIQESTDVAVLMLIGFVEYIGVNPEMRHHTAFLYQIDRMVQGLRTAVRPDEWTRITELLLLQYAEGGNLAT